jgi:tripartite-type tricarboxylate transporter receptor subunit TctC
MYGRTVLSCAAAVTLAATLGVSAEAPYYEGKAITVIVGLSPGGATDVFVRSFAEVMSRYIPGHPTIVVKNMAGSGGLVAANHVYEKAQPDGLTLYWSNWSPISQIVDSNAIPAPYDKFEFVGAVGDTRLVYARSDIVAGGIADPADFVKAKDLNVGGLNPAGSQDLLLRLSLDLLGVEYNYVPGYEGGSEVFAAILRDEVQLTSTSLTTFKTRNADFIESGQGRGLYYMVPAEADGSFKANPAIKDIPAFPEIYRKIRGGVPSGPAFDAYNWLARLVGDITIIALAPPGTDPEAIADLRAGYEAASRDKDFTERTIKALGQPYAFVSPEEGEAILASLSEAPPGLADTLKALIESAK